MSASSISPIRNGGRRLRIFALHSTRKTLDTTAGDMLNEARFLTSLSHFADVFYNGIPFQPDAPGYGLYEKEIEIPTGGYDLYYVRANHPLFLALPHPKITMGYPYDPEIFHTADAVVVTTEAWKCGLIPYAKDNIYSTCMRHWYGDTIVQPKRVINIRQTLNTHFIPDPEPDDVLEARVRLGLGKVLGFFGRIDSNTFPRIMLNSYLELATQNRDVRLAVAGTVRIPLHPAILRLPRQRHDKMPALVSACYASLTDEGNDAKFLGSGKVLDSMARGIPLLAYKTPTRIEQLGEYYPLYYHDAASAAKTLRAALFDRDIWEEARRQLNIRCEYFLPEVRAAELKLELEQVVRLCSPD